MADRRLGIVCADLVRWIFDHIFYMTLKAVAL
jgi:hypothetical protein